MATWALGDIHGCSATLAALLARLGLEPARDSLWLVGDLVNRGPDSLGVLRWARDWHETMGERFAVTLGNHDLHLLGLASGATPPRPEDTLDEVLAAADRDELLDWLAARPLVVRRGSWMLVHGGLLPSWSLEEAERRARAVEAVLRDPGRRRDLLAWPPPAEEGSPELRQARHDLAVFARLRTLRADETPCRYTGPPQGAPDGCRPWFDWPHRRGLETTVVFGHWAALGLLLRPEAIALDTGAAWGKRLTAIRLEDRKVVAQPVVDEPPR